MKGLDSVLLQNDDLCHDNLRLLQGLCLDVFAINRFVPEMLMRST